MGCFSGRLMSSASDQKLFCEICSAFNCFSEFVGEKVVSPSYSSAILAPPRDFRLLVGSKSIFNTLSDLSTESLPDLGVSFLCTVGHEIPPKDWLNL